MSVNQIHNLDLHDDLKEALLYFANYITYNDFESDNYYITHHQYNKGVNRYHEWDRIVQNRLHRTRAFVMEAPKFKSIKNLPTEFDADYMLSEYMLLTNDIKMPEVTPNGLNVISDILATAIGYTLMSNYPEGDNAYNQFQFYWALVGLFREAKEEEPELKQPDMKIKARKL